MNAPVPRVGARVLMLDELQRVLLIHEIVRDGAETVDHWLTPGGGVETGESLRDAAVREAFEETGVRVELAPARAPVHRQRRMWSWRGVTYDQVDHFFVARVDSTQPLSPAGLTEMERMTLVSQRWWSTDELRLSAETFVPADLADVIERVTAGRGTPA